ncbi:MAG: hypothetical protein KKH28_07385 [Elusimicrobia bacterium]|nr:hypothetical protein [Elusimicrobiota bacterium]
MVRKTKELNQKQQGRRTADTAIPAPKVAAILIKLSKQLLHPLKPQKVAGIFSPKNKPPEIYSPAAPVDTLIVG